MQIRFSARNIQVTDAIKAYASKKIEKFPRYFNRVQQVEVLIDKAKNGYRVEIITDVEHHDAFVATSSHDDLYTCLDATINRLIRQLKDHKSRLRDNKHHTPIGGTQV